jgi:hypothetical protein
MDKGARFRWELMFGESVYRGRARQTGRSHAAGARLLDSAHPPVPSRGCDQLPWLCLGLTLFHRLDGDRTRIGVGFYVFLDLLVFLGTVCYAQNIKIDIFHEGVFTR